MATLEHEIAIFLDNSNFGTLGVDLFYGTIPNEPLNCVAVLSPTGVGSVYSVSTLQNITILVRAKSYESSESIADLIYAAVHNQENILSGVASATHIIGFCRVERVPMFLGRDLQGCCVWSLNLGLNVNVL